MKGNSLILLLGVLYFIGGYLLVAILGPLPITPLQGGLLALIVSLLAMALLKETRWGQTLFWDDPAPDEEVPLAVWVLLMVIFGGMLVCCVAIVLAMLGGIRGRTLQ